MDEIDKLDQEQASTRIRLLFGALLYIISVVALYVIAIAATLIAGDSQAAAVIAIVLTADIAWTVLCRVRPQEGRYWRTGVPKYVRYYILDAVCLVAAVLMWSQYLLVFTVASVMLTVIGSRIHARLYSQTHEVVRA